MSERFRVPLGFRLRELARKLWRVVAQPRVIHRERLVLVEPPESAPDPIFIVGVHRSGTTLLRMMLDSHSRIACPPESYFLTQFAGMIEARDFLVGLANLGYDRAAVVRELRRCIVRFYDGYRASKGKPRWADKTPHYVFILPFLREAFGERARFVMIYRHPLDVVNSLVAKDWEFVRQRYDAQDPLRNAALYVKDALDRQLEFEARHPSSCLRLTYERLVAEPRATATELLEGLGEPWEENVVEFHRAEHDIGTGDPEAQVLQGFRPSIANWKGWKPSEIETATGILGEVIRRLGYEAS